MVSDKEAFEPWFTELTTGNPLNFPEYEEKIAKTQEKTGLSEGIVIGKTKIYGEETVLGVIDSRFMMGSMGHVVGEKSQAHLSVPQRKDFLLYYSAVQAVPECRRVLFH